MLLKWSGIFSWVSFWLIDMKFRVKSAVSRPQLPTPGHSAHYSTEYSLRSNTFSLFFYFATDRLEKMPTTHTHTTHIQWGPECVYAGPLSFCPLIWKILQVRVFHLNCWFPPIVPRWNRTYGSWVYKVTTSWHPDFKISFLRTFCWGLAFSLEHSTYKRTILNYHWQIEHTVLLYSNTELN